MAAPTPPPDPYAYTSIAPDLLRARIRTGAQSLAGFLVAALLRWLAARLGVDIPVEVAEPLRVALEGAFVSAVVIAWMVLVQTVSRRWPQAERLFVMRGEPFYLGTGDDRR